MKGREVKRPMARAMQPLLEPARFKGARGGRSSGKSHFFAEQLVIHLVENPRARVLCIREVQRSLKFSAKHLIENKIEALGVEDYFEIMREEIRSTQSDGLIAFTGMQDHTADSIKSFEDFSIAWFEEAHRMSQRSMGILIPTIRRSGSEIWFSWNPENPDDPVERLFNSLPKSNESHILVDVRYTDNPFCPQEARREAERLRAIDPDEWEHVWNGGFNRKNNAQVLQDKWRVQDFEVGEDWDGPYFGLDFGFSQDPTACTKSWIYDGCLYIEREVGGVGVDLDFTVTMLQNAMPGIENYEVMCDSARPESISHLKRHGLPRAKAARKWSGSVEDGIEYLRTFESIVIHPRCKETAHEAKMYSHKVDRISGQVMPQIVDAYNHYIDSLRYAHDRMIRADRPTTYVRKTKGL